MIDTKNYDAILGNWGPYNKEYLGISHISNPHIGQTFAIELFPGFFRRSIIACPSVNDGGVKMWGANPKLTHFVYRYELEWKDKVYLDAHFHITDDSIVRIDCRAVNDTDREKSVNLNLCACIKYPYSKKGTLFKEFYKRCELKSESDLTYINAVDYDDISSDMTMAQDGKYLCEVMDNYCTGGYSYIDGKYFSKKEHFVKYCINREITSLGIRYKSETGGSVTVIIDDKEYNVSLKATNESFDYVSFDTERTFAKNVKILSGECGLSLDCILAGHNAEAVEFKEDKNQFEPILREISGNTMTLRYAHSMYEYRIQWMDEPQMIRKLYTNDAGRLLEMRIHDHVSEVITDTKQSDCVYQNIFAKPLYLKPHSQGKFSFVIRSRKLCEQYSPVYDTTHKLYRIRPNSDGERYAFSQDIMSSTTLLNIVYPIYTRRGFIRHNTPGRNWDSLYTWDSGFIGLGLSTMDFDRAFDCLNTYLTPVGDRHSPYIFHGSVVPIQIFLYQELINKFPDKRSRLKSIYPMVRDYYDFFRNLDRQSNLKSHLLKTWHIFYNSGGWDDYPPQQALRYGNDLYDGNECYDNTTPVITTSMTVLIGRIMKNISQILGINEDRSVFDEDISKYSRSIQDYLWDEESGYYSYMVHDADGYPDRFMKYKDGTNFNMGFDGIYPYIAGVSDKHQSMRIKDNIINGLFTKSGVGVVDTRAPYYTPYGYWNGSVWMPHQWILYKALLDKGEITLASKIIFTALDVWKNEVDDTYSCFEHFMSSNGRGAGFHQFSGLSCPVLNFFSSFYIAGSIDTGFGTVIISKKWNKDKTGLVFSASSDSKDSHIIVCMKEGCDYVFMVNGKPVRAKRITNGAYALKVGYGIKDVSVQKK